MIGKRLSRHLCSPSASVATVRNVRMVLAQERTASRSSLCFVEKFKIAITTTALKTGTTHSQIIFCLTYTGIFFLEALAGAPPGSLR